MRPPVDHPPVPPPKVGVLLINLGTPNKPEPGSVRLYLKEFLSDPRVIGRRLHPPTRSGSERSRLPVRA